MNRTEKYYETSTLDDPTGIAKTRRLAKCLKDEFETTDFFRLTKNLITVRHPTNQKHSMLIQPSVERPDIDVFDYWQVLDEKSEPKKTQTKEKLVKIVNQYLCTEL